MNDDDESRLSVHPYSEPQEGGHANINFDNMRENS